MLSLTNCCAFSETIFKMLTSYAKSKRFSLISVTFCCLLKRKVAYFQGKLFFHMWMKEGDETWLLNALCVFRQRELQRASAADCDSSDLPQDVSTDANVCVWHWVKTLHPRGMSWSASASKCFLSFTESPKIADIDNYPISGLTPNALCSLLCCLQNVQLYFGILNLWICFHIWKGGLESYIRSNIYSKQLLAFDCKERGKICVLMCHMSPRPRWVSA